MKISIIAPTEESVDISKKDIEINFGDDLIITKDRKMFILGDIEIGRFVELRINPYELTLIYIRTTNIDSYRILLRDLAIKYKLQVKEY